MSAAPFEAPLTLTAQCEGRHQVVCLRGSASMDQAETLKKRLLELVQPAAPHLILDLSDLTFISSLGIGAIMAAHSAAQEQRGSLRLVHPSRAVDQLFHLVHLDQVIPTHATLDDARQAVKKLPS